MSNLVLLNQPTNSSTLTFSIPTNPSYDPKYTSVMKINFSVPSTIQTEDNPGTDATHVIVPNGDLNYTQVTAITSIDPTTNIISFQITGYMNGKRPYTGGGKVHVKKIRTMLQELKGQSREDETENSFDKILAELTILQDNIN